MGIMRDVPIQYKSDETTILAYDRHRLIIIGRIEKK